MDSGTLAHGTANGDAIAARLARAVAQTERAIVLCDVRGLIDWVNPGFETLTGFAGHEARGRSPGDLLRAEGADPATRDFMATRVAARDGFRVEVLNRTREGRLFWADLDVRPMFDEAGAFEGFIGVMAELRGAQTYGEGGAATPAALRSAARLARVGGWDVDFATRTVRWGSELQRLLGRPEQVEPMFETLTMYAPDHRERVRETLQASIDSGERFDFEARAITGDGRFIWLHVMGEPDYVDGVCVAIRGASQDVTSQREATEALREQQRFAQGVVDGVAAMLIVVDEDGRIIAANEAFKSEGARLRQVAIYPLGGNLFEIVQRLPGGHGRTIEKGIRSVLEGRRETFSRAYQSEAGKWFRMSASRFAGEGPVRCVVTTESIEDLKRSERRLRRLNAVLKTARDAADAANAAKSAFLATMSHEIRTPLNGVLGMAQAMARDELPPAQRERLAVIRHSGEALLVLLNDLLDLSRIEAGRLELEDGVFDTARLVEGVVAAFASLAADKGLDLTFEIAPQAQGVWAGDAARVRQILFNLVSNAVKFTTAGQVALHVALRDRTLVFAVRDTGCGVPPDRLESLFEKFVQADVSTTRRHGGSGLGLAICRELAALMGGSVTAESQEGRGSVFVLKLPARPSGEAAPARPAEPAQLGSLEGRGLRVLAVDDNPMNQLVLRTLLEQLGVETHMASDGAQALTAWGRETWDVILMDVQMPVMDGLTATREIRRLEAETGRARTPIVALTANAMAHHQAQYLAAGMDAMTPKPIELERLVATLEQVLV